MKSNLDKQIYDYICEYTQINSYSPSIRDIQTQFNFKSTSTVVYHLEKLQSEGLIIKTEGKNRAIITQKTKSASELYINNLKVNPISLIGTITAGQPIFAEENYQETYFIPTSLFRGDDLFMLNVCGESMIDAGIYNGDKIIIKKQSTADNGEIVAAMIGDSATVKRFYKENGRYRLQPENPTMEPIYCNEVNILGKVVGLIRKFN